jgi:hypothetical protein
MFDEEIRDEYKEKVQAYLLDRTWFKVVDALEEVVDYWQYGRDIVTMPAYNVYMPTRNSVFPRPNLLDDRADDISYKFNTQRISPYH